MKQITKVLLITILTSLGSLTYGMGMNYSDFSHLPLELRHHIASLFLQTTVGYNYKLFRKIEVSPLEVKTTETESPNLPTEEEENPNEPHKTEKKIISQTIEVNPNAFIQSLAFSPDGRTILTGTNDKIARLWDVETGKKIREFAGHKWNITSVAFSPDGKTILTGSFDETARLWNAVSGDQLQEFKGHTAPVSSVAFSPDSKTVLTGSQDTTARLWNAKSGKQLQVLKGHTNFVDSVAFSPDGKTVLTGSGDKTARVWDAETGNQLKEFKEFTASVLSVAFSPDGKTILTASGNTAVVWDVETGKETIKLIGHTNAVTSVAFRADGNTVLTGSRDGTARLWDVFSGEQLKEFKDHQLSRLWLGKPDIITFPVLSVALSKNEGRIATGSEDGSIAIYRLYEESEENTKKRLAKRKQATQKEYQEKAKLVLGI